MVTVPILSEPPDGEHIAACGLFCTNCGAFRKGKCRGCQIEPAHFARCPVRKCVAEHGVLTCAECADFAAPRDFAECGKLNGVIARIFSFVFRSDRPAALAILRDEGRDIYLASKRESGRQ